MINRTESYRDYISGLVRCEGLFDIGIRHSRIAASLSHQQFVAELNKALDGFSMYRAGRCRRPLENTLSSWIILPISGFLYQVNARAILGFDLGLPSGAEYGKLPLRETLFAACSVGALFRRTLSLLNGHENVGGSPFLIHN